MKRPPPGVVGATYEEAASRHLQHHGLSIVARNYQARVGELDIVAEGGRCLHFVEVRYRRSERFGGAAASITAAKQRRIARCARHFLLHQPVYANHRCQFDVVTVSGGDYPYRFEWLQDAFCA